MFYQPIKNFVFIRTQPKIKMFCMLGSSQIATESKSSVMNPTKNEIRCEFV